MSNLRQLWFIPRPERDPKFHKEALIALQKATDDFTLKWASNRPLHQKYEQILNEMGLKRNHVSADGSGGRTWAAMLRTFAYCYLNEEGFLVPTKVGRSIINDIKVFENIKKQILTLQIPNAYFLEKGFRPKFDDAFQIRPARFLIKLANQKELDYYVTKEEITFFVLSAKRDDELEEVTQKIKTFRSADENEKSRIKRMIANTDHRHRIDKNARSFEVAYSDVAHTFMLICEYTGLVEYIRGEALRVNPEDSDKVQKEIEFFDLRYPFNKRYLISLERMAENNGLDVDSFKASNYGTIKPATNKRKTHNKIKELLKPYPEISIFSYEQLVEILEREFPSREAKKIALELKNEYEFSQLNDEFVEAYLNEKDSLEFENKTGEIFKAIGFDVVMRPKPLSDDRTQIEILLKYGEDSCGIIDAKNYKDKFALTASLANHMAYEYLPNYDGYENRKVKFFGYVTASDFSGERHLKKICDKSAQLINHNDIKGIILNATTLIGFLDYCMENNIPKEKRINLFISAIQNKGYKSFEQLFRTIYKNAQKNPS